METKPNQTSTFELKDISGAKGVSREVKGTSSTPIERPAPSAVIDRSRV